MKKDLILFWSNKEIPYGIFSQWYHSSFEDEGITFTCAEQYMMYQKAMLFKDAEIAAKILKETNPKNIKALGRKVKNFDAIKWNEHKENIVIAGNRLKFSQNHDLLEMLKATGEKTIVEASPYDAIWGIGMSATDPNINNLEKWGQNLLGKALMKVREELKDE